MVTSPGRVPGVLLQPPIRPDRYIQAFLFSRNEELDIIERPPAHYNDCPLLTLL